MILWNLELCESQKERAFSLLSLFSLMLVYIFFLALISSLNSSIIAHIDHGKSTLADRLLELTNTIPKDSSTKQFLDKLLVEQERGITVKSQAVSMLYKYPGPDQVEVEEDEEMRKLSLELNPNLPKVRPEKGQEFLLQMLDTPGHMDFGDEVKRSLSACQTALLVIDATREFVYHSSLGFFNSVFKGRLTRFSLNHRIQDTNLFFSLFVILDISLLSSLFSLFRRRNPSPDDIRLQSSLIEEPSNHSDSKQNRFTSI